MTRFAEAEGIAKIVWESIIQEVFTSCVRLSVWIQGRIVTENTEDPHAYSISSGPAIGLKSDDGPARLFSNVTIAFQFLGDTVTSL